MEHKLRLRSKDYLFNGEKQEYDYEIKTKHQLGKSSLIGVFVLVSFIKEYDDIDDELQAAAIVACFDESENGAVLKHIQDDLKWFYQFCSGNWDIKQELLENDKEIEKRFKAFLPTWWKIVCELICMKFKSKTDADWIAKRRDKVGTILEREMEEGNIQEQTYIATYGNYKCAYEFCENIIKVFKGMEYKFKEARLIMMEHGNIVPSKDDVVRWNVVDKSTIIYDRENNFHFVLSGTFSLIQEETLKKLVSTC